MKYPLTACILLGAGYNSGVVECISASDFRLPHHHLGLRNRPPSCTSLSQLISHADPSTIRRPLSAEQEGVGQIGLSA